MHNVSRMSASSNNCNNYNGIVVLVAVEEKKLVVLVLVMVMMLLAFVSALEDCIPYATPSFSILFPQKLILF